jgi:hypothetical protein
VDTGSREESASKQESRASVLIQSEPKLWSRMGGYWDESCGPGVLTTEAAIRLLVRRLHRIRDVEHAHNAGFDLGVPGYRRQSGNGLCLDALGNRTENSQAATQ